MKLKQFDSIFEWIFHKLTASGVPSDRFQDDSSSFQGLTLRVRGEVHENLQGNFYIEVLKTNLTHVDRFGDWLI
jgi:hypothetical protein